MRFYFLLGIAALLGFGFNYYWFSRPGATMDIHIYAKTGNVAEVRRILDASVRPRKRVNATNEGGMTPLMIAAQSPDADLEMLRLLVEQGAKLDTASRGRFGRPYGRDRR